LARDDDIEEDDFVVDDDTDDDIDVGDVGDVGDVDDLVGDVDKDLDVVPLAARVVADDDEEIDDAGDADMKGHEDEEDEADEADHDDEEDEEEEEDTTDEEEQSLDVLLAREVAQDDDDLGRLDDETRGTLSVPTIPIGEGEFTCRSCFLVKRRAQLADEEKLICLDCA